MGRKYYLIDTENVGDRWFKLPKKIGKKDRIVTFYTEHHSKQLEKFLLKQVHNHKILWLECASGNNALDYQLMGALSYLIAKHPKASFFIFSNDSDYQDTVRFWQNRGIKIKQKSFLQKKKKKAPTKKVKQTCAKLEKQETLTIDQCVVEIAKSVPVSNLNGWYQTLIAVLGQENGRKQYLKIKNNSDLRAKLSKHYKKNESSRGINLIAMVLNQHNLDAAKAEEAYKIIQSHNIKNLNAIHADFDLKFGKNPQQQYYNVLKPLFHVIKGK